jgi:hypothetical protein
MEAHSNEVSICDLKLATAHLSGQIGKEPVVEVGMAIAQSSDELLDRVDLQGIGSRLSLLPTIDSRERDP